MSMKGGSQLYLESWPTTTSFSSTKMHLEAGRREGMRIDFTCFIAMLWNMQAHHIICYFRYLLLITLFVPQCVTFLLIFVIIV